MNFYEQLFCRGRTTGEGMTHFERLFAAKFGGSPPPEVREYTGAVPVTITADGTPLLDYLISGNMEQNGTPSPLHPSQPSECGERTENLWDNLGFSANIFSSPGVHTTTNSYGTTLSTSTGGSVEITQIASGGNINYRNGFFFIEIDSSQFAVGDKFVIGFDYEITNKLSTVNTTVAYVGQQSTASGVIADWSKSGRAVIPVTLTNAMIYPYVEVRLCGNSINVTNVQINRGSTALPYEPYGYKIPISSANTTTPVYLGEVETTRRIKKLVLTGDEAWGRNSGNSVLYLDISDGISGNAITSMCTEYPAIVNVSAYSNMADKSICIKTDGSAIWIRDTDISSTTDFKTHLQQQYANGTPVCVWYILATPTTGIVNEPIRKIGGYADTLSMEQAGVEIPTNNGTTVIDVDTELKPSEVYIKYMG